MKLYISFIVIFLIFIITPSVKSQEADVSIPTIGQQMPDFTLTNVHHYKQSEVSLKDFKGKWLFLDFWFTGCVTCIKSFPKINDLQEKFKDKIQYLLVGCNGAKISGFDIQEFYEKLRKKQNLNIAIAYDSILYEKWDIWSFPYIIIIDPNGIVRSITGGLDMNANKIQDLLMGKDVSFTPSGGYDVPPFEASKFNDSSENVIYRSLLTKSIGENQKLGQMPIDDHVKSNKKPGYQALNAQLRDLYYLAYFGKSSFMRSAWDQTKDSSYDEIYPYPVLEIKDTSLFIVTNLFTSKSVRGIYHYELTLPQSRNNSKDIMKIMQNDLKNIFGYDVIIEYRMMPVWKLISKPGAAKRLINKGLPRRWEGYGDGVAGFKYQNYPISFLLDLIERYKANDRIPYFDETGIHENIDIDFDVLLTDHNQVIRELQKNELDLIIGEKKMKVLIIRDPI